MTPHDQESSLLGVQHLGRLYRYADVTVSNALPLVELSTSRRHEAKAPHFEFHLLASPPTPAGDDWLHYRQTETVASNLFPARMGEGFMLRFPDLADFVISADGCGIGAWPAADTDAETLNHLLLDQVLPRLLAHQGRLVLHASAVCAGDRAIAFVGQTGCGKSTLAASLYAAGYSLLSDDGLVLTPGEGRVLVQPTYPGLRLWPEAVAGLFAETPALAPMAHYSTKQRVVMADAWDTAGPPLPLAVLYVLSPEAEAGSATMSLTRLSPRDACMVIIGNAFQLDVTDRRRAAGVLAAAGDIAQHVPAFALTFPRDFSCLPDVHAAMLRQRDHWATASLDFPPPG